MTDLDIRAEEILTKKEIAERLKVSVRKVEDLHLPCLRLGSRCNRYVWSTVLEYLRKTRGVDDDAA